MRARSLAAAAALAVLGATAPAAQAGTPFTVGAGKAPDVLVDPAGGAATLAWLDGPAAQILTCRLPRAATSCTPAPVSTAGINPELGAPHLLRLADGRVALAMYRYVQGDAWLWTSGDGGATFGAPVRISKGSVGTEQTEPTLAGDRLAFLSANGGGNVFGARLDGADAAATTTAQLAGFPAYVNGIGTAQDGTLVAASGDLANVSFWTLPPGQDPSAGAWSGPTVAGPGGEESDLASGPSGVYLQAMEAGRVTVRRWTGGGFGAPVQVEQGRGYIGDLTVGPSGAVAGVWRRNDDPDDLRLALSTDQGASFTTQTIAREEGVLAGQQVSIGGDARGLVVYESGTGQVRAVDTTPLELPTAPATAKATGSVPGADLTFGVPSGCVAPNQTFTVTLSFKRKKRKGNVFVKVTRTDFHVGARVEKRDRSAPFRQTLRVTASARPGSSIRLRARAFIKVRRGKAPKKSIFSTIRVCG